MIEQWSRWEPAEGLSNKYYIDSISDTMEELEIILSDANDRRIRVMFENSVDSYKSTDETYKLQLICDLDEQYGTDFYSNWIFFKITNSSYIQDTLNGSGVIFNSQEFIHFCIFTSDVAIDILATYEPKVELIENN